MVDRLIWAPSARQDLRDLFNYINEYNPDAARQFIESIFEKVHSLPDYPHMGRVVPEFNDEHIREIIRAPCRIIYRVNLSDEQIEIVRIWHAARGAPRIT